MKTAYGAAYYKVDESEKEAVYGLLLIDEKNRRDIVRHLNRLLEKRGLSRDSVLLFEDIRRETIPLFADVVRLLSAYPMQFIWTSCTTYSRRGMRDGLSSLVRNAGVGNMKSLVMDSLTFPEEKFTFAEGSTPRILKKTNLVQREDAIENNRMVQVSQLMLMLAMASGDDWDQGPYSELLYEMFSLPRKDSTTAWIERI